jgi:hypothetical protein
LLSRELIDDEDDDEEDDEEDDGMKALIGFPLS